MLAVSGQVENIWMLSLRTFSHFELETRDGKFSGLRLGWVSIPRVLFCSGLGLGLFQLYLAEIDCRQLVAAFVHHLTTYLKVVWIFQSHR